MTATPILRTLHQTVWFLWILALASCSTEPTGFTDQVEDGYLQLDFAKCTTRADLDTDGSGSFIEGDRIGLYIDNGSQIQYRELTYTSGQWTPRLKRQDFGTGELTLSAHYPVVEGISDVAPDNYAFEVATDQSTPEGLAASDLLVSQTTLETGTFRANFEFRHALHRLRVELTGANDDVTLSVRSRTAGTINLLTGEATLTTNSFEWITPSKNSDGSFKALIYPQDAAPYRNGDGTLLRISTSGQNYDFKAPEKQTDGTQLDRFEAGKQITVKLTLKSAGDLEWANRTVWVYGITAPAKEAWKQFFPGLYSTYSLPWKEEYGWYDCNKLNPTGRPEGVPDSEMCWAATASNLLHWWFHHNEAYILKYQNYTGPDYHYPLPQAQESDIFQTFIDAFENEAGYCEEGLNWFIHGDTPRLPAMIAPINPAGYFKDVFPEGVKLGQNIAGLSKERFNETIKDALKNKKGIGMSKGPIRLSHVVTIWGAEFDENGDVSYIYMADNNDRDEFVAFGFGCLRLEIAYETYPEGASYTCYKSGYIDDNRSITINRLFTLNLGQKYWEEYFKQHN